MDELISIVIPIYNVEKYLKNCVDSVCNQTYRNLEIILVDDGSPDHCPEICEDYARNDSRVRVIHKQNGGLSDARNYGIEVAKGKYITCIDSDDYVSEDFIEYLYKLLKDANADISVCGFIKTKNLNENRIFTSEDTIEMSSNQAIQEMLYAKIFTTSAWGKLYRTDLFYDVTYPLGKYSEDMYTTFKLLNKANKVVYGNQVCYYYLHRPNSILTSDFSSKHLDVFEALHIIHDSGVLGSKAELKAYKSQMVSSMAELMEKQPPKNKNVQEFWKETKKYRLDVLCNSNVSKRVRAQAGLMLLGYSLTQKVIVAYYRNKWR
jgi:glycosyltransferase involved in cell wall biosynthesis